MSARQVVLGVVLGAVALAALAAGLVLFLFRPLKAEPVALDALKGLRTREAPYGLEVLPQAPKALLAFYPGARVEPLAYAPVLAPLVGNGYLVVLLRVPQGIALLGQDRALEAGRAHPGLPLVVGGHSLGGVVAAGVAAREGLPLVLFAAYPEEDLSQEAFPTLALYGTEDGLLPPKEARRKAERLPRNARVVFVEGLNHAGFGAYGPQRGDRPATRPREALWEEVREEVLLFLEGLGWDTPPSPQALR
ncbi:alpha/beta hydrolase [Thermus thermophilus]|uniref:alpha/beta hydrolase n=1 Tax=Thermus thermophilus TaxID=274 RepID=UPI003253D709